MHHSRGRPLWEVDQWLSISCLREICCRFATYVSFIFHALVQEIRYVYVVKKQHDLDLSKNPSVFPTHKSCICHSCFPLNSVFFEAPCRKGQLNEARLSPWEGVGTLENWRGQHPILLYPILLRQGEESAGELYPFSNKFSENPFSSERRCQNW